VVVANMALGNGNSGPWFVSLSDVSVKETPRKIYGLPYTQYTIYSLYILRPP